MGGACTRAEAAVAFDRFWPQGLPFPPEVVVTDPMLRKPAIAAGGEVMDGSERSCRECPACAPFPTPYSGHRPMMSLHAASDAARSQVGTAER